MNDHRETVAAKGPLFSKPEMIVAVAAIVLSICGLFIALYEASIARRAASASVWPHVEVGTSGRGTRVEIFLRNTGVGPARIRAANVSHNGIVLRNWAELLKSLEVDASRISSEYSLIGGRVLGVDAESETIFAIDVRGDSPGSHTILPLAAALFDGSADVALCYCSVYDECWMTRNKDIMNRSRLLLPEEDEASGVDCEAVPQSGI